MFRAGGTPHQTLIFFEIQFKCRNSLLVKRSNWRLNYPVCRIDYIWYSKHWDAKSSSVLEATESDRLPVAAELILLTAARL